MGADYARGLATLIPGAVVSVIVDMDLARVHKNAQEIGEPAFVDADELIESKSMDAVLAAPHDRTHAVLTIAAVAQGEPVLCEKPLALTVEETESLVGAGQSQETSLASVALRRHFAPTIIALCDLVLSRVIGRSLMAHADRNPFASNGCGNWRLSGSCSCGCGHRLHQHQGFNRPGRLYPRIQFLGRN